MKKSENKYQDCESVLLTFREASDFLKVKLSWLRMAVFKKNIPYIKVGRLIRFKISDLHEWLLKNSIKK